MNPDPHRQTLGGARPNATGVADGARADENRQSVPAPNTAAAARDRHAASTPDTLDVRLTSIRFAAESINLYELRRVDGRPLPPATPGAHIDLHLPRGMIRQYSLPTIDPASSRYVIGVKRDPNSRGGSRYLHEEVRVGATLNISHPRNDFPVVETAGRSVFIAGGIGITPIRSMVRHLHERGRPWELHYACRTRAQAAFADELGALGASRLHIDEERGGVLPIETIVAATPADAHLYFCGPEPMRLAFEKAVAERPRSQVHVELFGNPTAVKAQAGSYVVELARSRRTFVIPTGETILDVLRTAGIAVRSSCEQGICGTCETAVLSGMPDHRDAVLSERERAEGRTMMICCSGSRGDRLVLDL
jgi:tetrachlorobenzoquinone reductase